MKIELSESEIDLIDQALNSWEGEEHQGALINAMFGVMLGGKDQTKEEIADMAKRKFAKAEEKSRDRRVSATMLRAKLYQARQDNVRATEFPPTVS